MKNSNTTQLQQPKHCVEKKKETLPTSVLDSSSASEQISLSLHHTETCCPEKENKMHISFNIAYGRVVDEIFVVFIFFTLITVVCVYFDCNYRIVLPVAGFLPQLAVVNVWRHNLLKTSLPVLTL